MTIGRDKSGEFDSGQENTLDLILAINELGKTIAERGEVALSQNYDSGFFDMRFWNGTKTGSSGNKFIDEIERARTTHEVLIFMKSGTTSIFISPEGILKIEFNEYDSDPSSVNDQIDQDRFGLNIATNTQAQLYLDLFSHMAEGGVGTDPTYSYENEVFFRKFEGLLIKILEHQQTGMDDADPVLPETLAGIKEAIEKITSKDYPVRVASLSLDLPETQDNNSDTNRRFSVMSVVDLANQNIYETLVIEYSYRNEDGLKVEEKLIISTDGSCSYNQASLGGESPFTLNFGDLSQEEKDENIARFQADAEHHIQASKLYKERRELGLDQPTLEQLNSIALLLIEANEATAST